MTDPWANLGDVVFNAGAPAQQVWDAADLVGEITEWHHHDVPVLDLVCRTCGYSTTDEPRDPQVPVRYYLCLFCVIADEEDQP